MIIPTADGEAQLAGDVMFPASAGPHRVLVSMYPYHKDDVIGSVFEPPRRALAAAGYATLLVDMRGTGASTGSPGACYDLGGTEGADGACVVEWTSAQPWCAGPVGMWGVSYGAMTALATAARRPPHLGAIVAVYGTNDCLHDAIAPGGSGYAIGRYSWVTHMLAMDLMPPTRQDGRGDWRKVWTERLERLRRRPGHAFEWQRHIGDESYWAPRTADISGIAVPTLLIAGWQDLYLRAMVRVFDEVTGPRRMLIGPWTHVVPDLCEREPIDWIREMCSWWDRYLHREPTEGLPRDSVSPSLDRPSTAAVYVEGFGWRACETWPAAGQDATLFADPERHLEWRPSPTARDLLYAPTRLTGQTAGLLDPLGTGLGRPRDQHDDDAASLSFTTAALEQPLEISGSAVVELDVTPQGANPLHLVAKLCDVAPDDSSSLIASGWRRLAGSSGASGASRARIVCTPAAHVVSAGHRIRLSLSSADFPRFWPTTGEGSFGLGVGGDSGARLTLPLRPGGSPDAPLDMPRPKQEPGPGWSTESSGSLRQAREEPGGVLETRVQVRNRLETPYGARILIEETFTARAGHDAGQQPAAVNGDVSMGLELADGTLVEIRVASTFGESSARATARVLLDGTSVLDESWTNATG